MWNQKATKRTLTADNHIHYAAHQDIKRIQEDTFVNPSNPPQATQDVQEVNLLYLP